MHVAVFMDTNLHPNACIVNELQLQALCGCCQLCDVALDTAGLPHAPVEMEDFCRMSDTLARCTPVIDEILLPELCTYGLTTLTCLHG